MAEDWISNYLEAILDTGPSVAAARASLLLRERGRFSPTRYFVEEVITGYEETHLLKTWARAAAMRSSQERNTRLENMCWRIWNLARKKKQIEGEEALGMSKRNLELERARRDATADMSEDLSEGEKDLSAHLEQESARHDSAINMSEDISEGGKILSAVHGDNSRGKLPHISSASEAFEGWDSQSKDKKLYIVLISIHGLIRGENMELGRDSDTGGQVKYVVEFARALGSTPGVYRVDLLTRQISAPDVDWSYGEPTEMLTPRSSEYLAHGMGESSGAYIIRIPFGPRDKYIPKELLWPYIREFVDGALDHIMQMSRVLGEQIGGGKPVWPIAIHGHYADAGDSAALLSGALNVPMLFTGHSLGRNKLEQLLKQGRQTREEINSTYKIMRRIEAEELALDASELIITSTRQEIKEQWHLYDGFDVLLERKLRARIKRGVSCYGRYMPHMVVIPPGMEFKHIPPRDGADDVESSAAPDPPIWSEITKFFTNPHKPMILALSRPDPKKNITALVKAFGECCPLRELANLTLIMGNRDDIDEMSSTNSSVLTSTLKLIDKHDLYGQVAYPKHHKQSDVPAIYHLAAKTKGVFINPAFMEPFGLTLIEAAANGLPIVATKNGGPVDIHKVLDNGILVDPHDQQGIADALYKLVSDKQLWAQCRKNGLKNIHQFSWPEHCKTYLSKISSCRLRHPRWQSEGGLGDPGPDSPNDSLEDIQDISLNLRLSMDGEKHEDLGSALPNEVSANNEKSKLENVVEKLSQVVLGLTQKAGSAERIDHSAKRLRMLKRKYLLVIAVDSVTDATLIATIKSTFEASAHERMSGSVGFLLSTHLTLLEIHSLLTTGGILPTDFDAFICNGGSDIYYPSSDSEDQQLLFSLDTDYHSQIEYRWGGDGLRRTLVRWAASVSDQNGQQIAIEDVERSSTYCHAFQVKNPSLVHPVKELRKQMRTQAHRCHVLYSHDGAKLHVIPVLASRSQALRYLFARWGLDISNMVVFVGESGNSDYEGFLSGAHKTVVLKGSFNSTPSQPFSNKGYPLKDVVAFDHPNILQIEGCGTKDIQFALKQLGLLKK